MNVDVHISNTLNIKSYLLIYIKLQNYFAPQFQYSVDLMYTSYTQSVCAK